jgi:hypothetical protein
MQIERAADGLPAQRKTDRKNKIMMQTRGRIDPGLGVLSPSGADRGSGGIAGLDSGEIAGAFDEAIGREIALRKEAGLPVAMYDEGSGRAYLEAAEGGPPEYVV